MNIQAERLNRLAIEQDMSTRSLAEMAGCSKSAMQRYMTGERNMPINVIEKLSIGLHVHPAFIMGWVDDRNYKDKKENPAIADGISEMKRIFIERVMQMSEEQLDRLDQIMKLVENPAPKGKD